MSCFVMVWKCYFGPYGITIFTRPVDYLIWFAVWGNSYMLRDIYLNKLLNKKHNGLIKVVTGIRRCGYSTCMSEFSRIVYTLVITII